MKKHFFITTSMLILTIAISLPAFAVKKTKPEPLSSKFKPLTGETAARTISAVKDALEKAAAGTTSVKGSGTIENEFGGKENVKDFTFMLKAPGKMRLEFTAPDDVKGVVMVTDGKTFWNYIPSLKKTYKVDLRRDSFKGKDQPFQKELGLLMALVNTPLEREAFWKKFEIVPLGEDKFDNRACWVVEFKVRGEDAKSADAALFGQFLWIEKSTGLTLQIELLVFGAPELVKINSVELNPKLDDSLFVLKNK